MSVKRSQRRNQQCPGYFNYAVYLNCLQMKITDINGVYYIKGKKRERGRDRKLNRGAWFLTKKQENNKGCQENGWRRKGEREQTQKLQSNVKKSRGHCPLPVVQCLNSRIGGFGFFFSKSVNMKKLGIAKCWGELSTLEEFCDVTRPNIRGC